jgi:transposase
MPRQYSPDFRQRALRLLEEALPEHVNDTAAINHVAARLGVVPETLRKWRQRYQADAINPRGAVTDPEAEIKRLRRENAELKKANEILKSASVFFAKELDRPTTK